MPDANGNPTQDDLNLANDLLTNLQARKNMSVDLSRLALQIKDTALADKLLEVQKNAEMLKATKELDKQLAQAKKLGLVTRDESNIIKEKVKAHLQAQNSLKTQADMLMRQKSAFEDALKNERIKLGLLKEELRTQQQIEEEARRQARDEQNRERAKTVKGIAGGAQQAVEGGTGAVTNGINAAGAGVGFLLGGPAGAEIGEALTGLGQAIANLFNQQTVDAAKLAKSAAGTGDFIKAAQDIDKTSDALLDFRTNVGGAFSGLTKFGLSATEVIKDMQDLTAAGLHLGNSLDEQIENTQKLKMYSDVMGVSLGDLGGVLLNLRRSTNQATNDQQTAVKLAGLAHNVVKADIMQQGEFLHMVDSVVSSMPELNLNLDNTGQLIQDLALNIKGMGGSAKTAAGVAGELMNSFKGTSDSFKAFIGSQTGAGGGGFAQAYYGAEQAGAGGDITTRQFDQKKWLSNVMSTIQQKTAGIADPKNRMYLATQLGKSAGLDEKGTQWLLKGILGKTTKADALAGAQQAEYEAQKNARPWAEQMGELLKKYVTTYLKPIHDLMRNMGATFKDLSQGHYLKGLKDFGKAGLNMASMVSPVGSMVAHAMEGPHKQYAGGGTMLTSGPIIAHRGEEILSPNIAEEYRKNKNRNNGGNSINITVNVEGDIDKAFDMAKKDTIKKLKQVHANTWG